MEISTALEQFLQIGIVGTGLSVAIQIIKEKYGTESDTTRGITIGLSIVLGTGYYFLVGTPYWLPIVGILGAATTFHALFLRK
jgi:hypothetical protein